MDLQRHVIQRWVPTLALVSMFLAQSRAHADVIYVTLQSSVVSFDLTSSNTATIAASKTNVATGLNEAMGLAFGNDGYLYVSQYGAGTAGTGTVSKINVANGSKTSFASGLSAPRGITQSPTTGTFYVANSLAPGSISQVTSSGSVSPYVTSGINAPYGAAVDASGAMYVSNNTGAFLTKIVAGVSSTFATFAPGAGTRGVAVSAAGDIYTAVANGVKKTTAAGVTTDFVASGMGFPFGLAWSSGGNLYVASYTDNLVYAYGPNGTPLYSFSTGAGTSNRPRYVAFNTQGSGFN